MNLTPEFVNLLLLKLSSSKVPLVAIQMEISSTSFLDTVVPKDLLTFRYGS